MNEPFKVFIGFDSREPAAFAVCAHSILRRSSVPVSITPLTQDALRQSRMYLRERGTTESTEFSLTRFLVPALCRYQGLAVFVDCDFLFQSEIGELFAYPIAWSDQAVFVCQHDYTPKPDAKFLGQTQTAYPRKNWSSLMVFNNELCRTLTPEYVNTATGLELHRLLWADERIGALPLSWNHLVGEYEPDPKAKALHFTLGGPWHGPEYADGPEAELWIRELAHLLGEPLLKQSQVCA